MQNIEERNLGEHKDTKSLWLLNWLKVKGTNLGYFTEREYRIGDRNKIDVVWKNTEEGDPIITFEVETTNSNTIFKNTAKIFGSQKDKVPKPHYHFMIVLKRSLTKDQKDSLFSVLNLQNAFLFENLLNDEKNPTRIYKKNREIFKPC